MNFLRARLLCINSYIKNDTEQWSLFYHQESNDNSPTRVYFPNARMRRLFSLSPFLSSVKMTHTHHSAAIRVMERLERTITNFVQYILLYHTAPRLRLGIPGYLKIYWYTKRFQKSPYRRYFQSHVRIIILCPTRKKNFKSKRNGLDWDILCSISIPRSHIQRKRPLLRI